MHAGVLTYLVTQSLLSFIIEQGKCSFLSSQSCPGLVSPAPLLGWWSCLNLVLVSPRLSYGSSTLSSPTSKTGFQFCFTFYWVSFCYFTLPRHLPLSFIIFWNKELPAVVPLGPALHKPSSSLLFLPFRSWTWSVKTERASEWAPASAATSLHLNAKKKQKKNYEYMFNSVLKPHGWRQHMRALSPVH